MVPGRARRRPVAARPLFARATALAIVLLVVLFGAPGRAADLSADDRVRLARGELIRRTVDVELAAGAYFGGVSYAVIRAPPSAVMAALLDPAAYRSILPLLLEGRVVGAREQDKLVFFRHGTRVGSAGYTAIVRRESPSLLRFWLDPTEPHDIADCWGYFRVQPFGERSTLLSYGALLRLDFGMVKLLFSEKIRNFALETPLLVRRYVESRGG